MNSTSGEAVFISRYGHSNEILRYREEIDINFSEDDERIGYHFVPLVIRIHTDT